MSYYRTTIEAPDAVKRHYPGATHIEIKGAPRSGYYSVFVVPASAGPSVLMGTTRVISVARAIASSIPAHRIHESRYVATIRLDKLRLEGSYPSCRRS